MDSPLIETRGDQGSLDNDVQTRTLRKLNRRVLPVCCVIAFVSYVDRGNLGFAAHDLCNALDLKHKDLGLGVSLFYVGYVASQVISNRMMLRFGPAIIFSSMIFSWGAIAAASGLIQNKTQFLILRLLLGIAEGGCYPGMFYYLNMFYPEKEVARAFMGVCVSFLLSFPATSFISAGLLHLDDFLDLEGWRWLFLVEGLVPVFVSIVLFFVIADSVEKAKFLDHEEKRWIRENQKPPDSALKSLSLLKSLKIILSEIKWWFLMVPFFVGLGASVTISSWMALIVQEELYGQDKDSESCGSAHGSATVAIILASVPFALQAVMVLNWQRIKITDRTRFIGKARILAGTTLASWIVARRFGFVVGYLSFCFGFLLEGGCVPVNVAAAISLFDRSLSSTAASVSNMTGNIGSILIPAAFGVLLDAVGYGRAILVLALLYTSSAFFLFKVRDPLLENEAISAV